MHIPYAEQLLRPEWDTLRKEVYRRANYRCQLCGKEKAKLNAHHSYYSKGAMAWEYPLESLIALCEPCHSKAAHGNPEDAIAEAVARTEAELESRSESIEAGHNVEISCTKQYLAYIIHSQCGGEVKISSDNFNPLADDYKLEYSYDETTDSFKFVATPFFDGTSAFGVSIGRRSESGDPRATYKMLDFVKLLHSDGYEHHVEGVFYDTKQNVYLIQLHESVLEDSLIADRIFTLAYRTLDLFEWFGTIQGKS